MSILVMLTLTLWLPAVYVYWWVCQRPGRRGLSVGVVLCVLATVVALLVSTAVAVTVVVVVAVS